MRLLVLLAIAAAGFTTSATAASAEADLGCGERGDLSVTVKPRDCFLGWPNLSLAEAIGLRHISWNAWGGPTATGRAVTRVKTYDPWTHVRVRASRRRACGHGASLYTRVRVDFGRAVHTWRTPGCADIHADG